MKELSSEEKLAEIRLIEKQKQKENFTQAMIKDPDYLLSWLAGLTNLEQIVVSILFQVNQAITTKEIWDRILYNTAKANVTKGSIRDSLEYNFPFNSYDHLQKELADDLINYVKNKESDLLNKSIEFLTKNKTFPSFRRIDKTIKDLLDLGIILKRDKENLKNKKIKGLYFLNPLMRTQLQKIKDKKIHELNERFEKRKDREMQYAKELAKYGIGYNF